MEAHDLKLYLCRYTTNTELLGRMGDFADVSNFITIIAAPSYEDALACFGPGVDCANLTIEMLGTEVSVRAQAGTGSYYDNQGSLSAEDIRRLVLGDSDGQ